MSQIFNIQFPDKTGFRIRWNRLVRVGFTPTTGSDGTEPAYTDLEVFQDLQEFLLAEIRP